MTMPSEFHKTTQQELAQDVAEEKLRCSAIGDDVRETAETLRGEFASAAENTKERISAAGRSMKEGVRAMARDQKAARAERLRELAHAINLAADEMQDELPQVAGYVRDAAAKIDNLSTLIRERSIEELVHDANDFARANAPTFFGLSLAAGFGLARFLKSSAPVASQRLSASDYPRPQSARETTSVSAEQLAQSSEF
jgi:ElaB/YqjD/DUF883 family membrane-anchored ribosome-binding protein